MNNRIVLPLLLVATLVVSCQNNNNTATPQLPDISVANVVQDSVTLFASYPGYLEAYNYVDIVARVNGFQEATLYKAGQRVGKGDTLFIIEPAQYIDAVAQAEAALVTAQSEFYYAENNYKRMKSVANTDAISEIDLIKSEAAYYQAEAAIKNAEAALQSARTHLGYCYIRAPFSGTLTASKYSDGDYVTAANGYMATLYQENKMYAYFSIDDTQYMKLIQNIKGKKTKLVEDAVRLTFTENLPHEYKGYIDYVAPNVDLSTGTLRVRIVVDNPYSDLKHGMYTTVHLPYSRSEKVMMVRDASIGTDQVGKFIYVVNDSNRVEMRHIETGELYNDTLRIVNSGLQPNERYVLKALQKVREGMTINPVVEQ